MALEDHNCVLCTSSTEESLVHLLIDCPFASTCWNWLGLQINPQANIFQNLESFRRQLQVPFFTEIILMCWSIWETRNGIIFNNKQPSNQDAKRTFNTEFALLLLRAKRSYFPSVGFWLNILVPRKKKVKHSCLIYLVWLIFSISFFVSYSFYSPSPYSLL